VTLVIAILLVVLGKVHGDWAIALVGGEGGGRLTGMGRQLRALALSPLVGQRLTMLGPKEHYTVLERLTELIEDGKLVPAIEQTYPLSEMPNAMRHLQAGGARGKLVIADRRSAIEAALERARPGDIVLLAGKGHEQAIIGPDGPVPWNERAEAEAALHRAGYG